MEAVFSRGPLAVTLDAAQPGFRFYSGGELSVDAKSCLHACLHACLSGCLPCCLHACVLSSKPSAGCPELQGSPGAACMLSAHVLEQQ